MIKVFFDTNIMIDVIGRRERMLIGVRLPAGLQRKKDPPPDPSRQGGEKGQKKGRAKEESY